MTGDRQAHHTAAGDVDRMLEVAAVSDRGPVRSENQDAWVVLPLDPRPGCALLLADGMGGHADGGIAAYLAVQGAAAHLRAAVDPAGALAEAVAEANAAVARHRASGGPGMVTGTTLVAAVVAGGRAALANVGDSRAYLVRQGEALRVTLDHSWVAEQVRAGFLDERQAQQRPERSLLTRALTGEPVAVDTFAVEVAEGDVLLLCSDGLWDVLDDARIAALAGGGEPVDRMVERACDAALAAGATDNVTVVACRVAVLPPVTAPPPEGDVPA